ncbi:hypothetical protein BV22DRAFT_930267 [Leucogyrophana mollusca]|uniref:Uncharacterized protein n=1 Tax=Leucogyrophana mollusca TaxID=85980 RepID=A0ACB8AWH8_9AGAM|nr:hypothetical protein BV22DRAFT_930267 [Leucogyrophana mollusca]
MIRFAVFRAAGRLPMMLARLQLVAQQTASIMESGRLYVHYSSPHSHRTDQHLLSTSLDKPSTSPFRSSVRRQQPQRCIRGSHPGAPCLWMPHA